MVGLMSFFMVASTMSIFGDNIYVKGIGMFVQGFLHLKIMLAYTHMFELTNGEHKAFCSTVINIFDAGTFLY